MDDKQLALILAKIENVVLKTGKRKVLSILENTSLDNNELNFAKKMIIDELHNLCSLIKNEILPMIEDKNEFEKYLIKEENKNKSLRF